MTSNGGRRAQGWNKPQMSAVTDRMLTPIALVASDSTLLYTNPAAARAIGQEPASLIGRPILDFVHPDDRSRVRRDLQRVVRRGPATGPATYRVRNEPAQQWRVFESTANNLLDHPDVEGILLSIRDVTEQREYERRLHDLAYLDTLTGLPNRANLEGHLSELMGGHEPVAVAFIGIDRFMLINDTLGPSVGDTVLKVLAARICSAVPDRTVVGRFAGNLFAVIVRGAHSGKAEDLLLQCLGRAAEPMTIAGHEFRLSVSIGLAHRHPSSTAESILRDAGLAHSQSKINGGGRVDVATAAMLESAIDRIELESRIRSAIANSEFTLAFQPIVRLADAVPVRTEAFVRWEADGTSYAPCDFIPVAEQTSVTVQLGDWIIDRAIQLASLVPAVPIMVNLSAHQLAAPGLSERVRRTLTHYGVPPDVIGFEITETLFMENYEFAVGVITELRYLGCQVGLDDFGAGYSSLNCLRRLPVDFVKIDRSLISEIDTDRRARLIVGSIIDMVSALDREVVAEGVETEGQARALVELGCGYAQGYYFGRPLEIGDQRA